MNSIRTSFCLCVTFVVIGVTFVFHRLMFYILSGALFTVLLTLGVSTISSAERWNVRRMPRRMKVPIIRLIRLSGQALL